MTKEQLEALSEEELAAKYQEVVGKAPGNSKPETMVSKILEATNEPDKEETTKKDEPSSPEKEDDKKMKGSVDPEYEFVKEEKDLVHFIMEDYAGPRPRNMNTSYEPIRRTVKMQPDHFVSAFGQQFLQNDNFQKVNTPGVIVRLANNVTKSIIEDVHAPRIMESSKGNTKIKAQLVENLTKQHKTLRLQGGNQHCVKVLHIPTTNSQFPFDPADLNKFPEECLY